MAGLVALPVYTPPGTYPVLPITALAADFLFTARDSVSNTFVCTGREIVLISGGASGGSVTVTSQKDALNRTGDITSYAVGSGLFSILGPFGQPGWADAGSLVTIVGTGTNVAFAVIRLPSLP